MKENTVFKFQLYIIGDAPHSKRAIFNLRELCDEFLAGRHEIEIIDLLMHPELALAKGILITPFLIRLAPAPICKIAGNLSNRQTVVETMILQI
jgi:circadian clock protein KaiB